MAPDSRSTVRLTIAILVAFVGLPLAAFLGFDVVKTAKDGELETFSGNAAESASRAVEKSEKAITLDPESAKEAEEAAEEEALAEAFEQALLSRLGIDENAELEGVGGEGIHRAVRHDGVWFPVFTFGGASGSDADGRAGLEENDLPLYITSASPPRYEIGESIAYQFQAIGGVEPYTWEITTTADGFAIDPKSGLFVGSSETELAATLDVFVRDAEGAQDSATYTLTIDQGQPLVIETTALPEGVAGENYETVFLASGGLEPYRWSTPGGLPEGFAFEEATGRLAGVSAIGFDHEFEFRVTDAGGEERSVRLPFRIASTIEFVTSRQLPPASPGSPWRQVFEVEGGVAPYEFRLASGDLPLGQGGVPWVLSGEGVLEGVAPGIESTHRFTVEVADSAGAIESKDFVLPIRSLLTVVPSREKAGLAWSLDELTRLYGGDIGMVIVTRSETPDPTVAGEIVYQGLGNNFVDRGLITGTTYFYTLYILPAILADLVEFGRESIQVLPFTRGRANPGVNADPFADAVKVFRPLAAGGHGSGFVPLNVTGPPDGRGTYAPASAAGEVLSLHARDAEFSLPLESAGGSVVLSFEDNIIELGPGEDFTVFENVFFINGDPNQRFMEPAIVSVALFEGEWFRFPIDVVPPAGPSSTPVEMDPFYYNRGFAGRNATTGSDPTDPAQSGGDAFDVNELGISGLTWIRYIRIQSTGHQSIRDDFGGDPVRHLEMFDSISGEGSSGFDLDAVSAVNY